MPHYDTYGVYNNDNTELFTDKCKEDRQEFQCTHFATNYKSCVIDGKNKNCCKTCGKFTECIDKTAPDPITHIIPNCNNMLMNPNYLNEKGLCKDSTWNTCCASCNDIKNIYDARTSKSTYNLSYSDLPNYTNTTPSTPKSTYNLSYSDLINENTPPPTTPPKPTTTPPKPTTTPPTPKSTTTPPKPTTTQHDDYYNQSYSCNDVLPNCKYYSSNCNDNTILGSDLRNYYCCQTCSSNR